jgi:hypothetical protein
MTSEKKIAANRANARKSTGPRTAPGKARAGQNAFRHGLASAAPRGPAMSASIERIAQKICGDGATQEQYDQALIIAESEAMLQKVRAAKAAAFERMMTAADGAQCHSVRLVVHQLMWIMAPLTATNMDGAPTSTQWARACRALADGQVLRYARLIKRVTRVIEKKRDAAAGAPDMRLDVHPLERRPIIQEWPQLRGLATADRYAITEFERLDRHERRWFARRNKAIRKLGRLKVEAPDQLGRRGLAQARSLPGA